MTFSVPHHALILVADGKHALLYRNVGEHGVKLEKAGHLPTDVADGKGPGKLPHESSPREAEEENFAKHVAKDLYTRLHDQKMEALVLVADPQTLGQLRACLHQEVSKRITGELHKTLVKSSVADIEHILTTAAKAA